MTTSIVPTQFANRQARETSGIRTGGIVVAVNTSSSALIALAVARSISRRTPAPVHVVSVLRPFTSYPHDFGIDQPESEVEALRVQLRERSLRDLLAQSAADADWTNEVLVGWPADVVASAGVTREAALLIVARRNDGLTDRIADSEMALHLIRAASTPVLVVGSETGEIDTVVVAADFSPASERAARAAIALMPAGGKLYLAHVQPPVDLLPDTLGTTGSSYPGDHAQQFRTMVANLGSHPTIVIEPVLLFGDPSATIIEFAERTGAQLIAAGADSGTRPVDYMSDSICTCLVRTASTGVLITPCEE